MATSTSEATEHAAPISTPLGVRIAGTLAAIVGVVTTLISVAIGLPAASGVDATALPLLIGVSAGIGCCVAAVMLWRRRRVGVLMLVLSVAIPTAAALAAGLPATGNILITAALLLAAANWKHLR